jgi:hypothetical protein
VSELSGKDDSKQLMSGRAWIFPQNVGDNANFAIQMHHGVKIFIFFR